MIDIYSKHCKCGKKIYKTSKRCYSCESKRKHKLGLCKYFSGSKSTGYKNGKTLKIYYCIDCNKKLGKFAYEGTKRCRKCWIKSIRGKNHPNWQGGIGKEPYSFEWTKYLKTIIIRRDDYKCKLCNKTQKQELKEFNKSLTVHHIDYNKQNCKESNLVTLCKRCNPEVNFNRDYWFAYFMYIMEKIYDHKKI
jgi:5-methylcytosine-specific restriction endonuclease McrA